MLQRTVVFHCFFFLCLNRGHCYFNCCQKLCVMHSVQRSANKSASNHCATIIYKIFRWFGSDRARYICHPADCLLSVCPFFTCAQLDTFLLFPFVFCTFSVQATETQTIRQLYCEYIGCFVSVSPLAHSRVCAARTKTRVPHPTHTHSPDLSRTRDGVFWAAAMNLPTQTELRRPLRFPAARASFYFVYRSRNRPTPSKSRERRHFTGLTVSSTPPPSPPGWLSIAVLAYSISLATR